MQTIFLNRSLNMKAMTGSIAIHAAIFLCLLFAVVPVRLMQQQMINVTLMTVSSATQVKKIQSKVSHSTPIDKKQSYKIKPLAELNHIPKQSAGMTEITQLTITKPLFDADYLQNPAPEYPLLAKRRNMEGIVMLDVVVSQNGTVRSVRISESSGFAMLDESAKNAVSRWKFAPAKRGGEPVEARVTIPIEFRLE